MKSFLLKVLLFLSPVCIFMGAVEMQLRLTPNVYSVKKIHLDNLCGKIELLCLGSSHMYHGINPIYFSKQAYNAANHSQTFEYDQKILEKYIDKMPALKTVIISVSYCSFFEKLSDSVEEWRRTYYALSMQVEKPIIYEDFLLLTNDRQEFIPSLLGRTPAVPVNELGFGEENSFEKRVKNINKSGEIAAERHTISDLSLQEEMKGIMENIVSLCESRNISVMMLLLPTHQSYRNNLNQHQLDAMYSVINFILQKYKNSSLFDASSDPDFIDDDFYDADHLNEIGAEKLTKKIDHFLWDRPLIQ